MKNIYKFILILVVVMGVSFYFGNSPAENISAANNEHAGDVSGCTVTTTTLTGVKEYGEDQGRTNGCRPTFFFDMPGNGYCPGGKCSVDISCEDGDAETYTFDNPGVPPGDCPPGANFNGTPANSPGRYPLIYRAMEGFLWKSKGNTYCKLVIYLPQRFGTGECEPGSQESPINSAETLSELVNLWRDIRENLHEGEDLANAQDEYDEIKKKMDIIKKQAIAKISEAQCVFPIYGEDISFSYYDPDVNNTDERISDPTDAESKLVLCPLSPRMISCDGFTLDVNSSNERVLERGRQVFKNGTPIEGSDMISCLGEDGETYNYEIYDGYSYTVGEC